MSPFLRPGCSAPHDVSGLASEDTVAFPHCQAAMRPTAASRQRHRIVMALTAALALAILVGIVEAERARRAEAKRTSPSQTPSELVTGGPAEEIQQNKVEVKIPLPEREPEKQAGQTAPTSDQRQAEELAWAESRLGASQTEAALREWEAGQTGLAWRHLESVPWQLRGWEHRYLTNHFNRAQTTFSGHGTSVEDVVVSPDGKRLLSSGGRDGKLILWDATTGRPLLQTSQRTGPLAFSPDGIHIVCADARWGSLRVRKADDEWTPVELGDRRAAACVAWSPNGKMIASGSSAGVLSIWSPSSGQELDGTTSPGQAIQCVAWSPDSRFVVSGERGGTIQVWDAVNKRNHCSFHGHVGAVLNVAFHPDGRRIVSGGQDQTLRVWEVSTEKQIFVLRGHQGAVTSVAYHPDGRRIVSGSRDQFLKEWDAESGQLLTSLQGHRNAVLRAGYLPNGKGVFSGGADGTIKLWDVSRDDLAPRKRPGAVASLAYSPDGKRIVSGGGDCRLTVADARTGEKLLSLPGHEQTVSRVVWSPDGKYIASGGQDGALFLWDAFTGTAVMAYRGHRGPVLDLAFSSDGKRLVSHAGASSPWNKAEVKVWNTTSPFWIASCEESACLLHAVAFSPNGQEILGLANPVTKTPRGQELVVWDAANGAPLPSRPGPRGSLTSVSFSPDGARIFAGCTENISPGDPLSTESKEPPLADEVLHDFLEPKAPMQKAPDEKKHVVRVWDTATGKELLTLQGHADEITSVVFSPTPSATRKAVVGSVQKQIVSAGRDGVVKVWDGETGQLLLSLRGRSAPINCLAFRPDGQGCAGGTGDLTRPGAAGEVAVWDAGPDDLEQSTLAVPGNPITQLALSGDGRVVAGFSASKEDNKPLPSVEELRAWDTVTGRTLFSVEIAVGFTRLHFSLDGKQLVAERERLEREQRGRMEVMVWDACTGQEISGLKDNDSIGNAFPHDLAVRDGKVWDLTEEREFSSLPNTREHPLCIALDPSGKFLAAGVKGGLIHVWDAASCKQLASHSAHTNAVTALAFSRDGQSLVSSGKDQTLHVWRSLAAPETLLLQGHTGTITGLTLSEDGQRLATCSEDKTVKIWDLRTGRETRTIKGHKDEVHCVAFRSDGEFLSSGAGDLGNLGEIKVWDVGTGKEILSIQNHSEPVTSVAFSPDHTKIVSSAGGLTRTGEVKVWDAATGKELGSLKGTTREIIRAGFSADSRLVLGLDVQGGVFAWDLARKRLMPNKETLLDDRTEVVSRGGRVRARLDGQRIRVDVTPDLVMATQRHEMRDQDRLQRVVGFDPVWHQTQAVAAEQAGQYFAAAYHLDQLSRAQPWDGNLHLRRAKVLARLGLLAEASMEILQALFLNPRVSLPPGDQRDNVPRRSLQ
jgi:WD40 repeat protein